MYYVPSIFETYFLHSGLARSNHILTQVKVHPQLSHNRHPVDDVLVVLVHSGSVFFFPGEISSFLDKEIGKILEYIYLSV